MQQQQQQHLKIKPDDDDSFNVYAIGFESADEKDRYVEPERKLLKTTNIAGMFLGTGRGTGKGKSGGGLRGTGRLLLTPPSPSQNSSKKVKPATTGSENNNNNSNNNNSGKQSSGNTNATNKDKSEIIVQLLMRGVWVITSIAPNVCEATLINRIDDTGKLPKKVINSQVGRTLGVIYELKSYFERNGLVVDQEKRDIFVANVPRAIVTDDVREVVDDVLSKVKVNDDKVSKRSERRNIRSETSVETFEALKHFVFCFANQYFSVGAITEGQQRLCEAK